MAAGLSLHRDKLEQAMARLSELLGKQGAGAGGREDLRIDCLLMPTAATPDFVEQLEAAGPFGTAAPAPRFVFTDTAVTTRRVGSSHLKISFGDGMGAKIDGIAFGAFDTPLGAALENAGHQRFHLAGRLELNTWGGRSKVQLRLEDAAKA
jgi:single-stranded-DNA-specific exonuclease